MYGALCLVVDRIFSSGLDTVLDRMIAAWLDAYGWNLGTQQDVLSEYVLRGKMHSAQRVTYFWHGCMLHVQRYVLSGYTLRAWMLGCF